MKRVEWSAAFETGIDEIDDQHRRLVGYINELCTATVGGDRAAIADVLESAIDYTLYHFAFEECLLESEGYEHLDAHKKVHDDFAAQLRVLKTRFERSELSIDELGDGLTRWLFDHIGNADTAATRRIKQ